MFFTYLFEAKSIQNYLFASGKLKDVIAASERLDLFIDSNDNSLLFQVIQKTGIQSDLLDVDIESNNEMVHFLRCKGGAFYAYCQSEQPLLELRSLWTLTVQQLFPSLEFTDAITQAKNLNESMEKAHQLLASDRNSPMIKLPIASAIIARYQRSGMAAVPPSQFAKRAANIKEFDNDAFDLDIEHHRQAYQALEMRSSAALQDRFTPDNLKGEIHYPINLEKDFAFSASGLKGNTDATKDLALVHIDGNGLGILLRALKNELGHSEPEMYRKGFRLFSEALNIATTNAAKKATQWLYDVSAYQSINEQKIYLPMRPIVLGGDDVTLLCRADLALEYSNIFCREFKRVSEEALKPLFERYLIKSSLNKYLTASGGILYAKSGHPFIRSHHLVEELCEFAKKLTKSVNQNSGQVGPAAIAFHRLSNAVSASFEDIYEQSQRFQLNNNHQINLGYSAYLVEEEVGYRQLSDIKELCSFCNTNKTPVGISKWRQMATHLAAGDFTEAELIYNRAISLCLDNKKLDFLRGLLDNISTNKNKISQWCWEDKGENARNDLQTIISDLLIIDHFKPEIENKEKESAL